MPQQNVPEYSGRLQLMKIWRQDVRIGTAIATPELAHSVHVSLLLGLVMVLVSIQGNETSTVNRTRTTPARGDFLQSTTSRLQLPERWDDG